MIPTTKSKALQGAYKRGVAARAAGQASNTNPYQIAPHGCHRRNAGTWGAVFAKYWRDGWFDEDERRHIEAEFAKRGTT